MDDFYHKLIPYANISGLMEVSHGSQPQSLWIIPTAAVS